ncbi:hypothetical protein ACQKWADRAFT_290992 [Trichoderma austrokoningii]
MLGGYIQVTTKQPRMFCIVHGHKLLRTCRPASLSFALLFSHVCATASRVEPAARSFFVQLLSVLSHPTLLSVRIGARGDQRRRNGTGSGDVEWWRVESGREWLVLLFRACG